MSLLLLLCHEHGGRTAQMHTNRGLHAESQPCPLGEAAAAQMAVTPCSPDPGHEPQLSSEHTHPPHSQRVPETWAPESLLALDAPKSPPTSHFLRKAWFRFSQEREDPYGHLFIVAGWGTPNWGSHCFLTQYPLLREQHGDHQPLENSSLTRSSPKLIQPAPFPLF